MSEENLISNKYKLINLICSEPFGNYYLGEFEDTQYLLLTLSKEASKLANKKLSELKTLIGRADTANNLEYPQFSSIVPIIELLSHKNIITLVMPYIHGMSLREFIHRQEQPLRLNKALKLLLPLAKDLTLEHNLGKFHGVINFSNLWITKDKKLKLLGFGVFNLIFDKIDLKDTDFYKPEIYSCISRDMQANKISLSIASDYYALLVITHCLLQGRLPEQEDYDFNTLNNINKSAKKLLTVDYYRTSYQTNKTLEQWFLQLKATVKWPLIESGIAAGFILSLVFLQYNQYEQEIKTSWLYGFIKTNYEEIFFSPVAAPPAVAAAINVDANTAAKQDKPVNKGFICKDDVCYDAIANNINGPKLLKIEFNKQPAWLMQSVISRRDYYSYCFSANDCSDRADVTTTKITECLFENKCNDLSLLWLDAPMIGLDSKRYDKYLSWLNRVTGGGYDLLPDQYWVQLADKFKPENQCKFILKTFDHPELVKLNDKLALRFMAKLVENKDLSDEPQCQTFIDTENLKKYQGQTLVRLVKK